MSQNFRTEADVMRHAATNVDTVNAETASELRRLQAVAESVTASWAGSAQVSFENLMLRYHSAAKGLSEALDAIAENIRANATNYEHTEADNTHALENVAAGLSL